MTGQESGEDREESQPPQRLKDEKQSDPVAGTRLCTPTTRPGRSRWRRTGDIRVAGAPLSKRSRRLSRNAGESEGRQPKHGEGQEEAMEKRLAEKKLTHRKGYRNSHQKPQKGQKPGALRPEGSH